MTTRPVFRITASPSLRRAGVESFLAEITSCEDRGEFWYCSYRPVVWLDGEHPAELDRIGAWGTIRVPKANPGAVARRVPNVFVYDMDAWGCGVRAAFTSEQSRAA